MIHWHGESDAGEGAGAWSEATTMHDRRDAQRDEQTLPLLRRDKDERDTGSRALPTPVASYVARVIPPRASSRRELLALETAMASLALDDRHAVALELVGDATGVQFLARASDAATLAHLTRQLQALYPQAEIVPIIVLADEPLRTPAHDPFHEDVHDPLRLVMGEAVTVVELAQGAPSYYALRTWETRAWDRRESEGADPILGVLSALQALPPGVRVISQLAMLPARAQWSRRDARKAVEHPLEPEREAARRRLGQRSLSTGPSSGAIIALAVVVVLALVARRFGAQLSPFIPAWVKQDVSLLLTRHVPHLTTTELAQLIGFVGVLVLLAFLTSRVTRRLQRSHPLYDMRQVGEKTRRVAYRARLRLIVIGPSPIFPSFQPTTTQDASKPTQSVRAGYQQRYSEPGESEGKERHRNKASTRATWFTPAWVIAQVALVWQLVWQWQRLSRQQAVARRQVAQRLVAAYRPYHQASGNYFVPKVRRGRHRQLVPRLLPAPPAAKSHGHTSTLLRRLVLGRPRWQRDVARSPHYLSTSELAALWHLPPEQDIAEVPRLARGRARSRLVSHELTTIPSQSERTQGEQDEQHKALPSDLIPYQLGTSQHAGHALPVFVPQELLHRHTLAVATTGKGKSTLFQHLALAHLVANPDEGLLFMEPHGDTIATLLGGMPLARQDDVTLIDLADASSVVGLNPLDMTQGRDRDKTVENILAVFVAFWKRQRSWGPRTENILQFALLTLAEANLTRLARDGVEAGAAAQYTLLDVLPLLQHAGYRHTVLELVRDAVLLDWWRGYYEPMRQAFRDEVISPVVNKISKYAAARVSRRLLGQSRATVRLRDDLREGRTLLINTAAGSIGEDLSALVGATLLGLFQVELAEQTRVAAEQRRRFLVCIDEFQTYVGINYQGMLAELRKCGGAFGLATQSLSYLDELDSSLQETVMANIDHLFAFTMSAKDARVLVPYLDGLEIEDVLALDDYSCYARLSRGGRRLPAFSLQIAPPPAPDGELADRLRRRSAQRNARPVATVDMELAGQQEGDGAASIPWPQDGDDGFQLDADAGARGARSNDQGQHDRAADGTHEGARQGGKTAARRGGGKGKGKLAQGQAHPAAGEQATRLPATPQGEPLSQPYALSTRAPRHRPRSVPWYGARAEGEERGESGSE